MLIIIFIILLTLSRCYECPSVEEGEIAQLEFQYPCDSTEVTLQHANAAPFYSSENPDSISQSNKIVTNNKNNETCSLLLTIYPVSRNDTGTYIPIAYKNGNMLYLQGERRIWLNVDYPPGKASCGSPTAYIPEEWVKIACTASKGTLRGQILCFQIGMRLPYQALPLETAATVDQTILARIGDPVYCCSSVLAKTKERCECKDWGWDPLKGLLNNNIDPCAAAPTTTSSPSSKGNGVEITTSIPLLQVTTVIYPASTQSSEWSPAIKINIFTFSLIVILVFIIIYLVHRYWREKCKNSPQKRKGCSKTKDTQLSEHEIVLVM